jgi:hypothetical protein
MSPLKFTKPRVRDIESDILLITPGFFLFTGPTPTLVLP